MPIEVTLAKLSPTMESGQLVKWLVKVGDKVNEGDTLAEIQTDKAVMPMESFEEGTVAYLDVSEGEDIALGQRVLLLATKGEDAAKLGSEAKSSAKPAKAAAPKAELEPANVAASHTPTSNGQGEPAETYAHAGGRVKSSPLARKVAQASQVDIAQVPGSGPGGRVIRRDVEAFLEQRAKAPAAQTAGMPARLWRRFPPRGAFRTRRCGKRSPNGWPSRRRLRLRSTSQSMSDSMP